MIKSQTKCQTPFRQNVPHAEFQEAPIIIIYAYKLNGAKYLRKPAQCAFIYWHLKACSRCSFYTDVS